MLSALGQLNSEILTSHYSPTMTPPEFVRNMIRRATALRRRAAIDAYVAHQQHNAIEEEVTLSSEAADVRHVARYTAQKNTMCVGPCVRVPHAYVRDIQHLASGLHGPERVQIVRKLARQFRELPSPTAWSRDYPRLCVTTGIPCVAAQFAVSGDVRHTEGAQSKIKLSSERVRIAEETAREATYTLQMARSAGTSQVREMELNTFVPPPRLRGGSSDNDASLSPHDKIRKFFHYYSLGDPPADVTDMRIALDVVSKKFAPRSRLLVVNDLWDRWVSF